MCKLPGRQTCVGDTPGRVRFILAVGFGCFLPVVSLHTSKAGPYHVVFPSVSLTHPHEVIGHEEHRGWHFHLLLAQQA